VTARNAARRGAAAVASAAAASALSVQHAEYDLRSASNRSGWRGPDDRRPRRSAADDAAQVEYSGGAAQRRARRPAEVRGDRTNAVRQPSESRNACSAGRPRCAGAEPAAAAARRERNSSRDRAERAPGRDRDSCAARERAARPADTGQRRRAAAGPADGAQSRRRARQHPLAPRASLSRALHVHLLESRTRLLRDDPHSVPGRSDRRRSRSRLMALPSPKIRTLVVEEEPVARARMLSLLKGEPDIEIIGECESGPDAVSAIEQASPDLVFLDIQMPQMDGLQLTRALGDRMPAVVFVTAY